MGGGASAATAGSQVVDLRALDPSPCPSRGSLSPLRSGHVHRRGSRCEDAPATQILEFLYLGSVKDAQDAAFLARHQIRYIINVSQEEYWSVDKKVQIFTFKVDDSATADIAALFQPTRDLINSIRGRYYRYARGESSTRPAVLVHCQKGRSRSATIVLAYLIYTNGWSVAEAMKYVGGRRPCAEPNIGFMEELRKLQESLSFEERTRRYSELCWFMRNLSAETSQSHVRELFEKRIGMVRHVVTYVVAGGGAGNVGDGGTVGNCGDGSRVTAQREAQFSASWPAAPSTGDSDAADPLAAFDVGVAPRKQSDGVDAQPAAKDGDTHAYKDASDAVSLLRSPSTEKTMLCFVFFTCREDVLHGIKSGQFQQLLLQLHPAAGKQIKYATGPKLKKIMTEHQSISSSFVQDMAGFSDHVTTPTGGESAAPDADGAVQTQGVAAPASKEAVVTLPA
ncbi:putative dual-specificity protein phosphatase [Leishmania mexicana MHOM/GT/2001/U1103]|uniref:protein-tyrosine-phosphatase n=1 Tax=Leishmania mexicana (strain MHOM/GT/2001/U1103) TaxID=929439 RepID=E9AM88_LEIMU|nr:putative dual-specificity protein phosphatase [Leishmania mexicana MHOM/GT/2001/U1103]CBZ24043.1 putative dual-specificity protein phosphatase [Leishmania mexicana MHOM/GT/2001/U1103]